MSAAESVRDPARVGYDHAAAGWADGAMLAYGPLARRLIERCPATLRGALALDAGAGTGAASAALHERGACVVAADLQVEMLRRARCAPRVPRSDVTDVSDLSDVLGVAADVTALPFRDGCFDVAAAAFVLNHLADPVAGVREICRVCRPGATVLASTFSARRAAAKDVIDDVARRYGWSTPDWYASIHERMRGIGSPELLATAAERAGLRDVEITEAAVDIGLDDPEAIARYRLGMPQYVALLSSLDPGRRRALRCDAVAGVAAQGEPFRPIVLELRGEVG